MDIASWFITMTPVQGLCLALVFAAPSQVLAIPGASRRNRR